jgi:hypothetical protein
VASPNARDAAGKRQRVILANERSIIGPVQTFLRRVPQLCQGSIKHVQVIARTLLSCSAATSNEGQTVGLTTSVGQRRG